MTMRAVHFKRVRKIKRKNVENGLEDSVIISIRRPQWII